MKKLSFAVVAVMLIGFAPASAARAPSPGKPIVEGRAIPLSAKPPAWYTLDYHRRVIESGARGTQAPPRVAVPAALGLASVGIRPGLWLVTVTTNPISFTWCSANFVFKKRSTFGLGTAGHCAAKDALGRYPDVTAYVVPPAGAGIPGFFHIGKFVLSRNNGIGDDFAMISIYSKFNSWVNPTMPVWGGPSGIYTTNTPTVVQHFGHGLAVGAGGTPRAGAAVVWTARSGRAFGWYGAGAPGDSGSGVRVATGQAAGNFTHLVVYDGSRNRLIGEILPGMLAGTRMTRILQIASGWSLVNGTVLPAP